MNPLNYLSETKDSKCKVLRVRLGLSLMQELLYYLAIDDSEYWEGVQILLLLRWLSC
jgi:hypothetical protein